MANRALKSAITSLASAVAANPVGWRLVFWAWAMQRRGTVHPIDIQYNINTSRELPWYLIATTSAQAGEVNTYAGCQPNCVSRAIEALPDISDATFLDYGCGRGRAMVVASEYGFRRIVGVDLSPVLCADARRNAETIARAYPDRPAISVTEDDATQVALPDGRLVAFIYHSFGARTMQAVVDRLEAAVRFGQDVTIIYENPVHHGVIDRSAVFKRWFGAQVACEPDERPHHPDPDEAIAIWTSGPVLGPRDGQFDIVTVTPGRRTEIVRHDGHHQG